MDIEKREDGLLVVYIVRDHSNYHSFAARLQNHLHPLYYVLTGLLAYPAS